MKLLMLFCALLLAPLSAHAAQKRVLMILTSHGELFGTGQKTGFWFEEMATPYYVLQDAGIAVTLASIRGGRPPVDPRSDDASVASVTRFKADAQAMRALGATLPIARAKPEEFDAVFLAGGHGAVWDFSENQALNRLLQHFVESDKPIAAVCHGPTALVGLLGKDGTPFVAGRKLTAFTKAEEKAVKLDSTVPFYLDVALAGKGATFVAKGNFKPNAVQDGKLITGQNPASSQAVAVMLRSALLP